MKAYVVSSGSYSDYCIEKIFLNYEKAQAYHRLISDSYYDVNEIEEFDVADDDVFIPYYYIEFTYYIPEMENVYRGPHLINRPHLNGGQYYIDIKQCLSDDYWKTQPRTNYSNGIIKLYRPIGINKYEVNIEDISKKYLKVCYDLSAQIKYWLHSGITECDIQKLFYKHIKQNIGEELI